MIRRGDELKVCGITDEGTLQVMSRMRGGGRHKDKKSTAEKNTGNLDTEDRRCSKPDEEEQVDDGLCAWTCEQVRSLKEMTSEDTQCILEKFEGLRMVMTSVKMQSTNENLEHAAKMEENLKRLMEEAQTKQEEVRPRSIEEQDVMWCLEEEVGKKGHKLVR